MELFINSPVLVKHKVMFDCGRDSLGGGAHTFLLKDVVDVDA